MTATPSSSDLSSGAQSAWLMLAVGTPARYSRVPDALSPRLHRAVVTPPCVCGGRGRTIRVHHRVQRREKGGAWWDWFRAFSFNPPLLALTSMWDARTLSHGARSVCWGRRRRVCAAPCPLPHMLAAPTVVGSASTEPKRNQRCRAISGHRPPHALSDGTGIVLVHHGTCASAAPDTPVPNPVLCVKSHFVVTRSQRVSRTAYI